MRIGLASDVHGRWNTLVSWVRAQQIDVVAVAGDLDAGSKFPFPVYYAFGNLDDRREYEEWEVGGHLENLFGMGDYEVAEIGGLKWMFVGCAFDTRIGPGKVPSPPPSLPKVDAIVTHEAPIRTGPFPPHPIIEALVRQVQPRWCFSGHRHMVGHGTVGSTECVALGTDPSGWAILHVETMSLILPPILTGGLW